MAKNFLPLMIDFSGRKVVIFGGGSVGERKAEMFCSCAETIVVSLDFSDRLRELQASANLKLVSLDLAAVQDAQIQEIISGAFLVIPATNNAFLNGRITEIAEQSDILINQVDSLGSVVIPSVIKRGDLMIGISTLGHSPALAKYTRRQLEKVITPQYSEMLLLQDEVRTYLKSQVSDQKERKAILWKILDNDEVWAALKNSYAQAAALAQKIVVEQIEGLTAAKQIKDLK